MNNYGLDLREGDIIQFSFTTFGGTRNRWAIVPEMQGDKLKTDCTVYEDEGLTSRSGSLLQGYLEKNRLYSNFTIYKRNSGTLEDNSKAKLINGSFWEI